MDFHQLIVPSLVPKHYYTQIWEQLLNAHIAATFNMLFKEALKVNFILRIRKSQDGILKTRIVWSVLMQSQNM